MSRLISQHLRDLQFLQVSLLGHCCAEALLKLKEGGRWETEASEHQQEGSQISQSHRPGEKEMEECRDKLGLRHSLIASCCVQEEAFKGASNSEEKARPGCLLCQCLLTSSGKDLLSGCLRNSC